MPAVASQRRLVRSLGAIRSFLYFLIIRCVLYSLPLKTLLFASLRLCERIVGKGGSQFKKKRQR